MRCPVCKADDDRVVDSRPWNNGYEVKRRRHCNSCHTNFTSYEKSEAIPLMVVKQDQRREPYDRQKVRKGIIIACRKRPVSSEKLEEIINDLEKHIYTLNTNEVASSVIGEFLVNKLYEVDEVAYVRFASVYKKFHDVGQFMNELKGMFSKI